MQPNSEDHMYTQEAVDAFQSVIEDEDFEPLSRVLTNPDILRLTRRRLCMHYGLGLPDEEMINQARSVIEMFSKGFGL